ncbi:hypothetical protein FRB90_008973 [Tulasnella sp. 427]|nr:hypothetical protein FRB90_008973 [Tulasnella sp. 427]
MLQNQLAGPSATVYTSTCPQSAAAAAKQSYYPLTSRSNQLVNDMIMDFTSGAFLTPSSDFIPDYSRSSAYDDAQHRAVPDYSLGDPYPVLPLPTFTEARQQSPPLPVEPNETPRTLYLTSPGTETGDADFADQSDDEMEESAGTKPVFSPASPLASNTIHQLPATPYTLGDLERRGANGLPVNEADLKCFTMRLQEDIKSAALFRWMPSDALSALASANTLPNAQYAPAPPAVVEIATRPRSPFKAVDDVTQGVGPHRTQGARSISRKASMHLRSPSLPINPYQRPSPWRAPPPNPYPAAVIDRTHLRRYQALQAPEPTISMKDLIVPNAEFHCGFDPETLVLELTSPPLESEHYVDAAEMSEDEDDHDHDHESSLFPDVSEAALPSVAELEDDEDDAPGSPEYEEPTRRTSVARNTSPQVSLPRRTTRSSEQQQSSPTVPSSSHHRRTPSHGTSKPRARHLQPNLVRTNGCQFGCQLFFSTAYEARRHQEDAHGREEAYRLMKTLTDDPTAEVYPREYKFLIQIGLHASGDKWDSNSKAKFHNALANEDVRLDVVATNVLFQFAREWTKRYECPRCGTSFSRLDSKKRHYEKQCR